MDFINATTKNSHRLMFTRRRSNVLLKKGVSAIESSGTTVLVNLHIIGRAGEAELRRSDAN